MQPTLENRYTDDGSWGAARRRNGVLHLSAYREQKTFSINLTEEAAKLLMQILCILYAEKNKQEEQDEVSSMATDAIKDDNMATEDAHVVMDEIKPPPVKKCRQRAFSPLKFLR
jgi:hypothetical protein